MLLFAAALLAATDLVANPATPTQPVQAAAPEKEKKICKVEQDESSSRLRKRTCLTASEWDLHNQGVNGADLKRMGAR
jgi:hypothetical protein